MLLARLDKENRASSTFTCCQTQMLLWQKGLTFATHRDTWLPGLRGYVSTIGLNSAKLLLQYRR